jgi:hypothetical protein
MYREVVFIWHTIGMTDHCSFFHLLEKFLEVGFGTPTKITVR